MRGKKKRTKWKYWGQHSSLICTSQYLPKRLTHNGSDREFFFLATKVNYFDEGGLFISAVYSAPLVLLLFIMQLRLFYDAFKTMTLIKRAEVRR